MSPRIATTTDCSVIAILQQRSQKRMLFGSSPLLKQLLRIICVTTLVVSILAIWSWISAEEYFFLAFDVYQWVQSTQISWNLCSSSSTLTYFVNLYYWSLVFVPLDLQIQLVVLDYNNTAAPEKRDSMRSTLLSDSKSLLETYCNNTALTFLHW
jgi:hypothetical protein